MPREAVRLLIDQPVLVQVVEHVEVGPCVGRSVVIAADVPGDVLHALLPRRLPICFVLGDKRFGVVAEPADGSRREPLAEVVADVVLNPLAHVVASEGGIAPRQTTKLTPKDEVVRGGSGLNRMLDELLDKVHMRHSTRRGCFDGARCSDPRPTEDGGRRGADSRGCDGVVGFVGASAGL